MKRGGGRESRKFERENSHKGLGLKRKDLIMIEVIIGDALLAEMDTD